MKEVKIEIRREDVMKEVSLHSAYSGAKDGDGSFFSRIATVNEDETVLTRFWNDTCGEVISTLKEFIKETEVNDDIFCVDMELSGSYDDSMTTSAERDLFSSISSGVASRWFRITMPERAAEWETRSLELLERAYRKLCSRKKPKRG